MSAAGFRRSTRNFRNEPFNERISHCLSEDRQAMRYLILMTALLFPTALFAQSAPTFEVFGRAGLVKLWDDESNIGVGPSIGGGAGVRLPNGVGVEGLFERHTN